MSDVYPYGFDEERFTEEWKARGLLKEEIAVLIPFWDRVKFAKMFLKEGNKPWKAHDYQCESNNYRGKRKVHRSGRSTGKTKDLEIVSINNSILDPNQETLIAAQREQHIEPLFERLIRTFTTNPDLNCLLKRKPQRSPDYIIELKNNHIIWGRIGGPSGQNFQGMHVRYQFIEEGQEMTQSSWRELLPGLNDGGYRYVWGVPNGVRNKYYDITEDKDYKLFSWNRENCPGVTEKDIKEWTKDYGGKTSADYLHLVKGEHGTRRFATFDIEDYNSCVNKSMKVIDTQILKSDLRSHSIKSMLVNLRDLRPPFEGQYVLGCDVGWTTDPTEIVLYVDDGKTMANFLRVHLEGLKMDEQKDVILFIDKLFPLNVIGIDRGGIGLGLEHMLQATDNRLNQITKGFHWGQNVTVGIKPDNTLDEREAKSFSAYLIECAMKNRTLMFPDIKDREDEYINMTHEVRKQTGQIVYSGIKDHIISADMTAILARYLARNNILATSADIGVLIKPIYFGGGGVHKVPVLSY